MITNHLLHYIKPEHLSEFEQYNIIKEQYEQFLQDRQLSVIWYNNQVQVKQEAKSAKTNYRTGSVKQLSTRIYRQSFYFYP